MRLPGGYIRFALQAITTAGIMAFPAAAFADRDYTCRINRHCAEYGACPALAEDARPEIGIKTFDDGSDALLIYPGQEPIYMLFETGNLDRVEMVYRGEDEAGQVHELMMRATGACRITRPGMTPDVLAGMVQ